MQISASLNKGLVEEIKKVQGEGVSFSQTVEILITEAIEARKTKKK